MKFVGGLWDLWIKGNGTAGHKALYSILRAYIGEGRTCPFGVDAALLFCI